MKKITFLLLIFSLFTIYGNSVKDYKYSSLVKIDNSSGNPSRIHLTPEIIIKSCRYPADIRLFDADGNVVPYVIYPNYIPAESTKEIGLKILTFETKNGKSVILAELPKEKKMLSGIIFKTGALDFNRKVVVEAETDEGNFKKIAEDRVFDYSSKISLRKTMIRFPEVEAKKLRVTIDDDNNTDSSEFSISYKGAILKANNRQNSTFKIGMIAGVTGSSRNRKVFYDSVDITPVEVKVNKDKSSYFYVDVPNIDINNFQFHIEDSFYFRKVEVCEPEINKKTGKEICRNIGGGSIYKMPGMKEGENKISLNTRSAKRLKIVVRNDDNPPLKINGITISWIRQHLYFIPEKDKEYIVYTGRENAENPVYDIARIVGKPSCDKDIFPEIELSSVIKNQSFVPSVIEEPGFLEKHGFTIVITLIFLILGAWLISLFKKY